MWWSRARIPALLGVAAALAFVGWVQHERAQVRQIPILMYHKTESGRDNVWWVSAEDLDAQLAYLREAGYRSILPDDLVANRRWGKPLPAKPVILTFDDGYLNTLTVAEPILRKHGFRGIVYLATTYVGAAPGERRALDGVPMLTWQDIRGMRRRGTFVFGAHTRNHVSLGRVDKPFVEVRASRSDIHRALGGEPRSFSYPFGDYRAEHLSDIRKARFTTAMLCEDRVAVVDGSTELLALPRVSVYGGRHGFELVRGAAPDGSWQLSKPQGPSFDAAVAVRADGSAERVWVAAEPRGQRLNSTPFVFDIPAQAVGSDGRTVVEVWDRSRTLPYFSTTVTAAAALATTP